MDLHASQDKRNRETDFHFHRRLEFPYQRHWQYQHYDVRNDVRETPIPPHSCRVEAMAVWYCLVPEKVDGRTLEYNETSTDNRTDNQREDDGPAADPRWFVHEDLEVYAYDGQFGKTDGDEVDRCRGHVYSLDGVNPLGLRDVVDVLANPTPLYGDLTHVRYMKLGDKVFSYG